MTDLQISTLALLLCLMPALVHCFEMIQPMWARLIVNFVLPTFKPGMPNFKELLTEEEQLKMLDAALSAAPANKPNPGPDYIFVLLFEQRQFALTITALAAGVLYGLNLPLVERQSLHFIYGVMAALYTLVNANQAGVPFLGKHPKISHNGRNVSIAFVPYWLAVMVLNYMAYGFATTLV